MTFALSLDIPQGLERECRERPNFANFLDSIRIIRRLAEFALRDFRFRENHAPGSGWSGVGEVRIK